MNGSDARPMLDDRVSSPLARACFDESPQPMWCYDPGTLRIVAVNEAAVSCYGWSADEFTSLTVRDLHPPAVIPTLEGMLSSISSPRIRGQRIQHWRKDGTLLEVEIDAQDRIFDGRPARLVQATDVTARVRAVDALEVANARLRALIEAVPVAIVELDPEGLVTHWNAAAERMYGWSAAEVIGRSLPTITTPSGLDGLHQMIADGFAGVTVREQEATRRRKDGTLIDVTISAARVVDGSGRPSGLVAAVTDVTDRKLAVAALRESERQHRAVADNVPLLISFIDTDERYRFVNRRYEVMFGLPRDAIIGRTLREHVGADAYERMRPCIRSALRGEPVSFENTLAPLGGTPRNVLVSFMPQVADDGTVRGFYSITTDITERKQLEEQFRQAQKMEAVGQLAGGIAHDFNNLLTVILSHSEFLLEDGTPSDERIADVQQIRAAAERAAALTRQLLAFSRKQNMSPKVIDLNGVVAGMEDLLARLIGEDIQLVTVAAPDLKAVSADPSQLEQVLVNLVVNARDAMPGGGRITIISENVNLDEDFARRNAGIVPGAYVMIAVSDTGVGMAADVRERIFEPFFTTKAPGKGTGLGLATVYGIVKQSGGTVWVDSTLGVGTTFRIYLPQVRGVRAQEGAATLPSPLAGTETVLIVEDDDAVRALAQRTLVRQGYTVLAAINGRDALLIAGAYAGPIHLLLTDVIMPEMGGRELADEFGRTRPLTRVLFSSGYAGSELSQRGVLPPHIAMIEKPYGPDTLARRVRDNLDERPRRKGDHTNARPGTALVR